MKSILSKSILLGLFYYSMITISACITCKCSPIAFTTYSFKNITIDNIGFQFYGDTSYSVSNIDTNEYEGDGYGLMLIFGLEKYAQHDCNHMFNFTNKAFACDCVMPVMTPRDTIEKIRIVTKENFNVAYAAGSDITNLFVQLKSTYNPATISKEPILPIPFHQTDQSQNQLAVQIYLNAQPETPRDVQLDIEVILSNGKVLNATTQKVFLK